jgi:hypothetical protein
MKKSCPNIWCDAKNFASLKHQINTKTQHHEPTRTQPTARSFDYVQAYNVDRITDDGRNPRRGKYRLHRFRNKAKRLTPNTKTQYTMTNFQIHREMTIMLDQGITMEKAVQITVERLERYGYLLKRGFHGCLRGKPYTISERDFS